MNDSSFQIRNIDDVPEVNVRYTVYNAIYPGSPVIIMPKVEENHLSLHPAQDLPVVFYNVGLAVVDPDRHAPTTSQSIATQYQLSRGSVVLYHKDDFFETISAPDLVLDYPHTTLTVVTLYKYDGSENPTLTYYLK